MRAKIDNRLIIFHFHASEMKISNWKGWKFLIDSSIKMKFCTQKSTSINIINFYKSSKLKNVSDESWKIWVFMTIIKWDKVSVSEWLDDLYRNYLFSLISSLQGWVIVRMFFFIFSSVSFIRILFLYVYCVWWGNERFFQ